MSDKSDFYNITFYKGDYMSIMYFLDTETTGLNPHAGHTIIEFCCIKHVNRKPVDKLSFKVIPSSEDLKLADETALSINKFDLELWHKHGISQHTAAKRIAEFVIGSSGSAIIAHNVKFDIAMIKALMKKTDTEHRLPYRCIDSQSVAYALFQPFGLRSFSLDSIRDFLGWSRHNAHTAEQDVDDLVKLWDILSPTPITDSIVAIKNIIVDKRIYHGARD